LSNAGQHISANKYTQARAPTNVQAMIKTRKIQACKFT
jgi:hypothetical protein